MPSFGLLKEQIFTNLEKKYAEDRKLFEEGVSRFVKALRKSEVYSELFHHYNAVLGNHFDDPDAARDYLNETVEYLRSLKIGVKDRTLMEALDRVDLESAKVDPLILALDTLVFSSKKHIKERLEAKQLLLQKLLSENKQTLDPRLRGIFLDLLHKKIKTRWSNLTESEAKAINAFADQNEDEILANYIQLVDDNINAINEQLARENDTVLKSKLNQAKVTLAEMKEEKPTLGSLERLLTLKEGFIV